MAHQAGDVLRADKEPPGIEPNVGCLKAPLMVTRLFLKKPERMAALGWVWLLALRRWRRVESTRRRPVETTRNALTGWDKQATHKPTAFMMMTTCSAVMVLNVGSRRQLAHPWSTVPQPDLLARGVPVTSFTEPERG
jgi:hypothetical protein